MLQKLVDYANRPIYIGNQLTALGDYANLARHGYTASRITGLSLHEIDFRKAYFLMWALGEYEKLKRDEKSIISLLPRELINNNWISKTKDGKNLIIVPNLVLEEILDTRLTHRVGTYVLDNQLIEWQEILKKAQFTPEEALLLYLPKPLQTAWKTESKIEGFLKSPEVKAYLTKKIEV